MSEGSRSASSTALIVGFVIVALAAIGGGYALDTMRRDGRTAATRVNNELRTAEQSLADLGAAEASYIAAGQNAEASETWMNTATAMSVQLENALANLSATSTSDAAKVHYANASPLVATVTANDRKARGLIANGQTLVAADVVLIEGADTVKQLKAELSAARDAEMADFESKAAQLGWIGLGAIAAVGLIGVALLVAASKRATPEESGLSLSSAPAHPSTGAPAHPNNGPAHLGTGSLAHPNGPPESLDLSPAADLCVELGLVQDSAQLTALMARAANVLEAKGLVLWVSESGGGVLRPTMAHGYSEKVLQRMGTLGADGDNVTSLAFRTRQPQVVHGSIDGQGALAVPLVSGAGCVGVLAAEVQGAAPGDTRFAIARIIAAQLSTLIAPSASSSSADAPQAAGHL